MTVQELYERFPYPGDDPAFTRLDDIARALEFLLPGEDVIGQRVLDLGCGTGQRLLSMAERWPRTQFTGIDFSNASVEFAQKLVARSGLANIRIWPADAFSYVPEQPFNLVVACGVLHHLERPAELLQRICQWLVPDGFILTWVYHPYGEHERTLQRNIFQILLKGGPSNAEKLLEDLGIGLSMDRYGNFPLCASRQMQLAANMDAFLNPIVQPMTFGEILDLFAKGGFCWGAIHSATCEQRTYLVDTRGAGSAGELTLWSECLSQDALFARYRNLDIPKRLQVLEMLTRPTGFTAVAGLHSSRIKESRLASNGWRFKPVPVTLVD